MKALVTGANGFLGAWLTRRLLAEGYEVSALVRKSSDLSELAGVKPNYLYGDVTDKDSLKAAFKNQEHVFHLAGLVSYKESERPLMDKINVDGTRNVVEVCEALQTPKLLHVSSVTAVGASFKPVSLNENSLYDISYLNMGYFETKKHGEEIVRKAARENRIRAVCVNPSTIYGFGDAKKGSRKTQVKVARGKFKFYTGGGVNVVPVEDVVEGILLALQKGKNAERYILAGENMTIHELFYQIAKAAGVNPPSVRMPDWLLHTIGFTNDKLNLNLGVTLTNAYTASMYHWFDNAKARQELGFNPGSSQKAIENSVRWMRDNGYLK